MKELTGLKVKAIAVDIPEGTNAIISYAPTTNVSGVYLESSGTINANVLEYINGAWQILGRANEIPYSVLRKYWTPERFAKQAFEWREYCKEQGITNELILIEQ